MDLGSVSEQDLGRILCLSADCNPTALRLSAAEGYLLSRIDGHTPWRLLREIGGLSSDEVDICLENWIADGIVEMRACEQTQRVAPKREEKKPAIPGVVDKSEIDASLEISVEDQHKILEFESGLGRGYAEILGVKSDADTKAIKKAYRKLSRQYHPDRYFKKQIAGYAERLDVIFKKVLEAYELLSDPATRAEVQKADAMRSDAGSAGQGPAAPDRPLTPIERLRQRMPFKIPQAVLTERRKRARGFYDSARTWAENGHFLEAASGIRLAIAFDPSDELYKQKFVEIQSGLAEERVKEILKQAGQWSDASEFRAGLSLCEEALLYRPHDPEINYTAAQLSLFLKEAEAAREYAARAIEHSSDVGRYHQTLARALSDMGDRGHAIRELERALELDSGDEEAKKLLDRLRTKPPRAAQGGLG
jgi:curved DNA-binding protein CbpA